MLTLNFTRDMGTSTVEGVSIKVEEEYIYKRGRELLPTHCISCQRFDTGQLWYTKEKGKKKKKKKA